MPRAEGLSQKSTGSLSSSFLMFLLFNLCFLSLQFVFVYSTASHFINTIELPWRIYKEIIATALVHIGLYVILSFIEAQFLLGVLKRRGPLVSLERWQVIIWSVCVSLILSLNAYYFPLSVFSKLIIPPLSANCVGFIAVLSFLGFCLLLFNRLLYLKNSSLFLAALVLFCVFFLVPPSVTKNGLENTKANIILLSIDSLSLENVDKERTPFLYQQLNRSVQFTNTVSPLARTFPAWCSILTGLYTKHHHADENLVSKQGVKRNASITWLINELGYNSLFASDDRRFNTLDIDFGFKRIVGPKVGVNDVLLGTFNDFPLAHLLINLRLGALAFPYNHMNRASFFSYYPNTFDIALQKELLSLKKSKLPLFLAVHFTLPHWPYAFAGSLPELAGDEFLLLNRKPLYDLALRKVDQQVGRLFYFLKEHRFLNNSLLILLSDHGETLYTPNSRLTNYSNYQGPLPSPLADYFKSKTATELDKSAGHGSDLLSPEQYHSMLGFRLYEQGKALTKAAKIRTRVALIDIAPTIMAFLNPHFKAKMDGISLLPSIVNPKHLPRERSFFIESGMFPNQDISKEKALKIGQQLYKINTHTGELELKPKALAWVNQQKLYGLLKGDWILALYPNDKVYIPVIQNLKTGQWIDDLESEFAQKTPGQRLLQELHQFYGLKLAFRETNAFMRETNANQYRKYQ